jgi:hypothetical protein
LDSIDVHTPDPDVAETSRVAANSDEHPEGRLRRDVAESSSGPDTASFGQVLRD